LKPYLDILEPVGICWLPHGYHFPADLRVWLDATLLTDPPKPKRSAVKYQIMFIKNSLTQKYVYTWYVLKMELGGVGVRHLPRVEDWPDTVCMFFRISSL
jgi:hypothetical protein